MLRLGPIIVALTLLPAVLLAQGSERINAYRYILDIDAPEPLATTTLVVRDLSPYFLAGGGIRDPKSSRSMTVWGRLRRVITKTTLSLGAAWNPAHPGAPQVGLALRATFHDPHPVREAIGNPFLDELGLS